jgi:hypothetical protein
MHQRQSAKTWKGAQMKRYEWWSTPATPMGFRSADCQAGTYPVTKVTEIHNCRGDWGAVDRYFFALYDHPDFVEDVQQWEQGRRPMPFGYKGRIRLPPEKPAWWQDMLPTWLPTEALREDTLVGFLWGGLLFKGAEGKQYYWLYASPAGSAS